MLSLPMPQPSHAPKGAPTIAVSLQSPADTSTADRPTGTGTCYRGPAFSTGLRTAPGKDLVFLTVGAPPRSTLEIVLFCLLVGRKTSVWVT